MGASRPLEEQSKQPFPQPGGNGAAEPPEPWSSRSCAAIPSDQAQFKTKCSTRPAPPSTGRRRQGDRRLRAHRGLRNSPFDRWHFSGGDDKSGERIRQARVLGVPQRGPLQGHCHTVSQTHALFSDSRFPNINNVGFPRASKKTSTTRWRRLSRGQAQGRRCRTSRLLANKNVSLSTAGRFSVSDQWRDDPARALSTSPPAQFPR